MLEAEALLRELDVRSLVDLTGSTELQLSLGESSGRHAWSLGFAEQLAIQALIKSRGMRRAFEIGTFNGGTTRLIAECLPADGSVVTLDLPPAEFDETQRPSNFTGRDVGREYLDSPAAGRVTQLLEDSMRFNASPYEGEFDLVLVDGGHEYEHGCVDTATALRLVAPGGIILWDDFEPYWHGLVRGIVETMAGRGLARLAGTSLGVYVAPG